MVAGFEDVAQAVGNLMFGGDAVAGGMLCGFAVLATIFVVFVIFSKGEMDSKGALMGLSIAVLFDAAVSQWWPIWTVLFIVIPLAFILLNPLRESG